MRHALLIRSSAWRPDEGTKDLTFIHRDKPGNDAMWPWIGYVESAWRKLPSFEGPRLISSSNSQWTIEATPQMFQNPSSFVSAFNPLQVDLSNAFQSGQVNIFGQGWRQ